ncbi:hypothetical protein V5O48_000028 [Marasmius crinis-equi]|uniref:C2 domain-containing protein n=1 Tax=Marasmius crinis-equi TaxID=585013 RepID=A0ABR3G296_9AGAR
MNSRLKKLRSKSTSTPSPSRSPSPGSARSNTMPSTPTPGREIGTLIVVVLKANHLPNKRNIGKQDPYCVVTINGKKQRTKAIKKGGQHPEWDEELRFKILEEPDDTTPSQDGTPPPPPPKGNKLLRIQGGTKMRVACYADDLREPDFIGDTYVDLDEVLTKGETDEWFTLMHKDRFAGKVYLELTFWSNEPPPQKKVVPAPVANKDHYAGPGVFVPAGGEGQPQARIVSSSAIHDHHRRLSENIRPSSSMLDLYQPAYERNPNSAVENLSHSFGDISVRDPTRSETYPPTQNGYRAPSPGFSAFSAQPSHVYDPSASNGASGFMYDRPVTPNGSSGYHPRTSLSSQQTPYAPQTSYQPEYESSPSGYRPTPPARGPRYSIPVASSGFVPLSSSSSFSVNPAEPSGFAPPASHTPAPYPSQINAAPPVSHTPYPIPPSSSFYDNRPGTIPPPDPQYNMSTLPLPPPSTMPVHPPAPTPMPYGGYPPGPEIPTAAPTNSLSSSTGPGGSRPLPLPQGPSYNNLPPSTSQPIGNYSPSRVNGLAPPIPFPSVPPPPPLPTSHSGSPHSHSPQSHSPQPDGSILGPPPPQLPIPPSQFNPHTPNRRASLPVPPVSQGNFQPLPPPPPPPAQYNYQDYQHIPPPPLPPSHSHTGQMYYPGPPPKPPAALDDYPHSHPPPTSVSYGGY